MLARFVTELSRRHIIDAKKEDALLYGVFVASTIHWFTIDMVNAVIEQFNVSIDYSAEYIGLGELSCMLQGILDKIDAYDVVDMCEKMTLAEPSGTPSEHSRRLEISEVPDHSGHRETEEPSGAHMEVSTEDAYECSETLAENPHGYRAQASL